jgi:hypothetical protein
MEQWRPNGHIIVVALILLLTGSLWSQTGTSRIAGTITDSAGAVVSGAKITATEESKAISRATSTNQTGGFSFESMTVGSYTLTIEAHGFKTFSSAQNQLTIGQPLTLNVKLQIGAVSENVTVTSAAEVVQTTTSGNFGNVEDQAAILNLPIVGSKDRNPLDLVLFQPGVVAGSNAGGGVHVNGARDRAWDYTLDGVDINETSAGGGGFSPTRTNPDMLAEFRVVTGNATAELGHASGGNVQMISKSGSDQFHGNLFWFYQTPGLNANEVANKIVTPELSRNMFLQNIAGFSLGGPLIKKHTFFFVNFQGLRTLQTAKVTRLVLTDQARKGMYRYIDQSYSDCIANSGDTGCSNTPAGAPGASVDRNGNVTPGLPIGTYNIGAQDPQNRGLDPTMQQFLGLTPLPNDFTVGDGLNVAGFSWTPSELELQQDWNVRIDHIFNDRHSIFGRWTWGHQFTNGDIGNAGQPPFPGSRNWVDTQRIPKNLALNWRWTPNNRSTNELVLGMNRFTFNFLNPDPNVASNPPYMPNYMFGGSTFNGDGCFPACSLPIHNDAGNLRALTTYQLSDNFTFAAGRHTLRWGGQILYQRHVDDRGSVGIFNADPAVFFDLQTNPLNGNYALPDSNTMNSNDSSNLQQEINDLLGRVGAINEGFVSGNNQWAPPGTWFHFDTRFPEYDLYLQDNWKITPRLTVDAGIRWEIRMSPRNPHNLLLQPNEPMIYGATDNSVVNWVPGNLYKNQWGNFGPSVGVAWDPFGDGKTSIRANYRLAYDRINTFVISSAIIQGLPGLTYSYTNNIFGSNGGRISDGLPPLVVPPGNTPDSLRTPPPFSTNYTTVMDPNLATPRTHMWGLSIQRELPHKLGLEVDYIGRHGSHLFGGYDANQYQISPAFIAAFKQLQAGQQSSLINAMLNGYVSSGSASDYIINNYGTMLGRNSIGELAKLVNLATDGSGNQLIADNGFSPYYFNHFPQYASEVDTLDTHDWSNYNALQVQLQRRFSNGLQFQASYSFSKSLDTRSYDPTFTTVPTGGSSQSTTSVPWDYAHRNWNYAPSDFDRRHVFQGDWVWELPFGQGKMWMNHVNPVLDRTIGGWTLSGIFTLESGRPFTVFSGGYTYSDSTYTPASCNGCSPDMGHLNWQGGAPYSANASLYYFTPDQQNKFYTPDPGSFSNLGRNYFRLPHNYNLDMALAKNFHITERQIFEVRLDAKNVTNSVMYDLPASSRITSGAFGLMSGQTFNAARHMQFSAKYTF